MITLGIPTFNEERVIANAIKSALSQLSKKDELIVVASGCTDNTVPEIRKLMKKDRRIELIIESERKGKASALNLIIKNAKGDIIVQTDGDAILEKNAIQYLLGHFENKKVGAVSGNPIPLIPKSNLFYDWTIMSYKKSGEIRERQYHEGNFWHLSGYLLAFRKKALQAVPFAKGAVDAWMGRIVRENGYTLAYEPRAKVYVKAPLTIRDFVNQKARVRAGYYLLPKGPRTMREEIFYLPKELFKVPVERWTQFILSGFIYAYSWFKGYYLAKTNASLSKIWKIPYSTK
ncbi:glycosyltransferase [Candidatus Pacearchaeota archaeon]|nr:glycosyltransferase [Candidatus Pacearchaeota archaeon]